MSAWIHTTLGALCRFVGGQGFPPEYQGLPDGDVPFIKVSDMELPDNSRQIASANNWLTDETVAAKRFKPQPSGAVVFAKIGEAIKRERVRVLTRPTVIDNNMMAAIPQQAVDPEFLFNLLRFIPFSKDHGGTSLPYLRQSDLAKIEAFVPPVAEQERIAGVLGAFDDLIETNRRLASDLETLAKGVSSRPRSRVPLAQVADVPRLVQRRPEGLVDHYSIPAYDSGYLASRESSESILSGKQMLVTDSVLISRLNPTNERTWMVYPDEHVSAVCSPEFAVVRGTEELPSEILWAFASRPDFWDQMRGSVGGTTNSRQRVDKAAIPAFEVPDPSELSAQETAAIRISVRAATELRREAAALSSQRDELLPLLMSGKVRVRDVEAAVS